MLHTVAEDLTEAVKKDEADGVGKHTKDDVSQRPAVIEGTPDEQELGDNIDDNADEVEGIDDDPERDGVLFAKGDVFEGTDGEEEADEEEGEAGQTHDLRAEKEQHLTP